MLRVGIGYDVHRLVEDRDLILGGVQIPYEFGLLGHSDADVLVHAIMDAILGAAGQGDIGKHFPDTDPKFKGISSMKLLEHVVSVIKELNFTVHNVDSVIVAQRPKLAPYIYEMRQNLAKVMGIPESSVNVKATTTEGLGFTGTGEGIAAHAVASLNEHNGS